MNSKFTFLKYIFFLPLLSKVFSFEMVTLQQLSLRWCKAGKRGMKPIQYDCVEPSGVDREIDGRPPSKMLPF